MQPTYEIGHRAVEVLFDRKVHRGATNVSKVRVPATLVVRDSSRTRFWVSQDQRHTVRTHLRYQIVPRVRIAGGAEYGSGLPFEFERIQEDATAQFGQAIAARVNFGRAALNPSGRWMPQPGADFVEDGQIHCSASS